MMINILFNSPLSKVFHMPFRCVSHQLIQSIFKRAMGYLYTIFSFLFSQPSTENNFKVEYDEFTAFYLFIFGNCSFELGSFVFPSFPTLSETYAAILRTTCRFDIFCLSDTIGLRYPYRHHIIALWCILLNVCVTIGF